MNVETQIINVPGMLFLPPDGVLLAKLRDKGPSFDTTSTTAQLVRAKGQHR